MKEIKATTRYRGSRRWESVEAARRKVKDGQMYFLRRHGSWFRPDAHGYTIELCAAGIYDSETARDYLDVEGLSVVSVRSMKEAIQQEMRDAAKRFSMLCDLDTTMGRTTEARG